MAASTLPSTRAAAAALPADSTATGPGVHAEPSPPLAPATSIAPLRSSTATQDSQSANVSRNTDRVELLQYASTATEHACRSLEVPFPGCVHAPVPASLQRAVRISMRPTATVLRSRKRRSRALAKALRRFPLPPPREGQAVPNAALLRYLLELTEYDDVAVADILAHGAPLLGPMGGPGEWPAVPPPVPAKRPWSRERILREHAADRSALLASVTPSKHDRVLLEASENDVKLARMVGPFHSLEELARALGTSDFVVSRRFGVEQTDKVRPCDDLTRAGVNSGILVERKLKLSTLDAFFALANEFVKCASEEDDDALSEASTFAPSESGSDECDEWSEITGAEFWDPPEPDAPPRLVEEAPPVGSSALHAVFPLLPEAPAREPPPLRSTVPDLVFWKRDHDGAYRQILMRPEDFPLAAVVFCHPDTGQKVFYSHRALPFGATASVYGYNRVARAVVHIARAFLGLPVDSYFDDFWAVDRRELAQSSFALFGALNVALGLSLKRRKDLHPTVKGPLLGVQCDLGPFPFRAEVDPDRCAKLVKILMRVLAQDLLPSGPASSLAGKLQFASCAIFGRVGRAALRAIYARQYSTFRGHSRLTIGLRAALCFLCVLLQDPPARLVAPPSVREPHYALYTDGAGTGWISGVLLRPGSPAIVFQARVPDAVLHLLMVRKQQIALIELLAVLTAIEAFGPLIAHRDVLLMIDNKVAEVAVRNGYVRRDARDACVLASALWLALMRLRCTVWVDRVSSKLNISDGPTRPNEPAKMLPLLAYPLGIRWITNPSVPGWAVMALQNALARA